MPKLTRSWTNQQIFLNLQETETYIASKSVSRLTKKDRGSYTRSVYQCSSKHRFNCDFQVQLISPHDSTEYQVAESGQHQHPQTSDQQTRVVVGQCVGIKMQKKSIENVLGYLQLPVPAKRQFWNMINYDRTKEASPVFTIADLAKWCIDHKLDQAQGLHDPFVPVYHIEDEKSVFVMITTRHLLSLAGLPEVDLLQVDATYKVIWNKFPVKFAGTTDKNRHFHPFCLVITTSESKEAYTKLFSSLIQALSMVGINNYKPSFVMGDGADAISGACEDVFPDSTRLMCFFHAKKALRENRNRLPDAAAWATVEHDVDIIRNCPDPNVFQHATGLMVAKWEAAGWIEWSNYFRGQWIDKLPNWYQGAALTHVSSNNGLENLNGEAKRDYTLRKALPLSTFLDTADRMIRDFSKRSMKNGFKTEPIAEGEEYLRIMTTGFQFATDPERTAIPRPEFSSTPNTSMYFVPTNECCCSVEAFLAPFLQSPGLLTNFEEFERWLRSYYIVENARGWFFCTCPASLIRNTCKHSIGIQIAFHGLDVPDTAKAIPIGQRRGPGRPRKVGSALSMD